ncbi:MAG TPA: hypothetical protein DCS93_32585 [Microscillaceae bacterium]|nr:hypothetical protein [Microscillaceae bacterium]
MLEKIILSILGVGKSKSDLRKQTLEKVRNIVRRDTSDDLAPALLNTYVDKVARHAYKVVDRDLEALKTDGFSEDEIFELTVTAAFAAGEARVKLVTELLAD